MTTTMTMTRILDGYRCLSFSGYCKATTGCLFLLPPLYAFRLVIKKLIATASVGIRGRRRPCSTFAHLPLLINSSSSSSSFTERLVVIIKGRFFPLDASSSFLLTSVDR
ncbi:hypothetical protein TYRP_013015 [Tyrophagus putrescentiae]|nr:hypothetical protein TYRP_013015 [Tyrophagus putrescentiae]